MLTYGCPKCGRTVEREAGSFFCQVCGPSVLMVPMEAKGVYRGWEIREVERPIWPWLRWEGRKGELRFASATEEELRRHIDEREEYELRLRLYGPAVAEREITLKTESIKVALEQMVGFYPEEMRVEVETKPPRFIHRGPKDAWEIGWWMTPPLPLERATFRSDPTAMAREVLKLGPKRVVLIGPAAR